MCIFNNSHVQLQNMDHYKEKKPKIQAIDMGLFRSTEGKEQVTIQNVTRIGKETTIMAW